MLGLTSLNEQQDQQQNEKNYVKFDTIEDWMKAYDIAMTQRHSNSTVKTYLNTWGTWTVWLPENILNKKVKDLSAEEKKTVQNAQIKKRKPLIV